MATIARTIKTSLATLALFLDHEVIDFAEPLDWATNNRPPLVEGSFVDDILDGYHRIAGYLRHARDNDVSLKTLVDVVQVLDKDLAVQVCEHGSEDESVLQRIYEAAGWAP